MRISDWSSDVCSSDLAAAVARDDADAHQPFARRRGARAELETDEPEGAQQEGAEHPHDLRNIGSRRESDPFGEQPKEQQQQIDQDHIDEQRADAEPRAGDPEFEIDAFGGHELANLLRFGGAGTEERRVGKEGVRTGMTRLLAYY